MLQPALQNFAFYLNFQIWPVNYGVLGEMPQGKENDGLSITSKRYEITKNLKSWASKMARQINKINAGGLDRPDLFFFFFGNF